MLIKLELENETIKNVFMANTFISRFLGYMFQKQPKYEAVLIKPCDSIHTYFMKFDIDVWFLNDKNEVIKKITNLKPGKVIMPVKGATMVLERKSVK